MKVEEKIINRFDELISIGNQLLQKANVSGGYEINSEYKDAPWMQHDSETSYQRIPEVKTVNKQSINQWGISCLHLLKKVMGIESDHYISFRMRANGFTLNDNFELVSYAIGIMRAAKDDYKHSYLFDTRALIEAEVFDDFLEQAEHLLKNGYYAPAAVIAGSVLEDGLRKLCQRKSVIFHQKQRLILLMTDLQKLVFITHLPKRKSLHLLTLETKPRMESRVSLMTKMSKT